MKPGSLALQADYSLSEPVGKFFVDFEALQDSIKFTIEEVM